MSYFRLGIEGEGFHFFLPDNFSRRPNVIGTPVRRTITGSAKRDVIAIKNTFELGFADMSNQEYIIMYTIFLKNIEDGKELTFIDDEDNQYDVIWGAESFGLEERIQGKDIFWSGTIVLEEV